MFHFVPPGSSSSTSAPVYAVKNMKLGRLVATLMVMLMVSQSLAISVSASTLTVEIKKSVYKQGDEVEIFGTASAGSEVYIEVNFSSTRVFDATETADEEGEYSVEFMLSTDAGIGKYVVNAFTDTEWEVTEFEVVEEVNEDEDDVERAYGLYIAIERALRYLERIDDTAENFIAEEYSFDQPEVLEYIRGNLTLANNTLRRLLVDLGKVPYEDAVKTFSEMQGLLGRSMGLIQSTMVKNRKMMMAESFMEQTQNQIRGLEEKILRLQERLEAEKVVSVGNSLGAIHRKIERLRERLGTEDLEVLLDDLQLAANWIDGNLTMLNGEGMLTDLREMNKIEARIRVLTNTAEKLSRKGYNTTEVEEQLEAAGGLLDDMMAQLLGGDSEGTKGLFREAKEHFKEIRENIHTSWMEKLKQRIEERKENRSNGQGGD